MVAQLNSLFPEAAPLNLPAQKPTIAIGTLVCFRLCLWGEWHDLRGEVIEGMTNIPTCTVERWERLQRQSHKHSNPSMEIAQTPWQPEGVVMVRYRLPQTEEDRVVQLPVRSVNVIEQAG